VEFRLCDIGSKESIIRFISSLEKDYPKIDILVNNAAIAFKSSDPTPFRKQARPTIFVNFFGTLGFIDSNTSSPHDWFTLFIIIFLQN